MGKTEVLPYRNTEEYCNELIALGKRLVNLYCSYTVDLDDEGGIASIKGKLLFKKELSRLCEKTFSDEEKAAYDKAIASFMDEIKEMHKLSRKYIAGGEIVAMEYLYWAFGFREFEWYMMCMAFLAEAEPQFERVFSLLQDDFGKKLPTIGLCIRMFTLDETKQYEILQKVMERWEFLSQFFTNGFYETTREAGKEKESVLSVPLKIDTRIIRFIYDVNSFDEQLRQAINFYLPSDTTEPMLIRTERVKELEQMYQAAIGKGFLYLSGEHGIGKKFLVRHFCKTIGRPVMMIDAKLFFALDDNPERLIQRLARETILKGNAFICIADMEIDEDDKAAFDELVPLIRCFHKAHLIPIFTSTAKWKEATQTEPLQCMQLIMEPTTQDERKLLWDKLLKHGKWKEKPNTERLAGTYRLPTGAIGKVIKEAETELMLGHGDMPLEKRLYAGCQRQLVHNLGKDAVQIVAQYTMEELVLPQNQKKMLQEACDMVRFHHQVFDKWGFHKKMAYGKGVSMIFYGPPGTGKTMGAQAIANELNLELYRVDMASVLSKYVGESEKKLGNIFEQGEKSQSILFFDEADALFGKRSEVKDSQDKYANASTAFLLQKLEEYKGVIILATNLLQNFDTAFCRRFHFIIEFPFPDIQRREEIWRMVFPEELPREELDYPYLAEQFVLSGSQIKNIAVAAAFLAAGEGDELKMVHILRSIKREMKKTGKNMIASDFGVYYSLMEGMEGE